MTTQLTAYGRLPRERGIHSKRIDAQRLSRHQKANPIQWIPACAGKTEEDQAVISRTILSPFAAEKLSQTFARVNGYKFTNLRS